MLFAERWRRVRVWTLEWNNLLALSLALSFYQHQRIQNYLAFQRKDFLLIAGILFLLIGLMGVGLAPIYSVIISITIYAGIKIFIGRRKKMIEKEVGEGFCAKCGSKIENQKCPICDRKKSWNVQFLRAVYTDLCLIYDIELKKI